MENGQIEEHKHSEPKAHSVRGFVLAIACITLTLFRFSSEPSLFKIHRHGFVPFIMIDVDESLEVFTYIFWYIVIFALVAVSFEDRLCESSKKGRKVQDKMLVPEVLALFVFLAADSALVVVTDVDRNDNGHLTMKQFEGNLAYAIFDMLPRFWLLVNFCVLISATVVCNISPPSDSLRGIVFEFLWPLIMAQLAASCIQRSASRSFVIQHVMKHNNFLATTCGMSCLFFTHSLAMSLAIVFRAHEHEHAVPSVSEIARRIGRHNSIQRMVKIAGFCGVWLYFNSLMQEGMMEDSHEQLLILTLNCVALVAAFICPKPMNRNHHGHPSWEATLVISAGILAMFCWWAEILGPDSLEEVTPMRTMLLTVCAMTHIALTTLFADVFHERVEPPAILCLIFTFWAGSTLFVGAKREHHAAVLHERHAREHLSKWELLQHLGEFGLCEFGLISSLAWVTYLTQHADKWWGAIGQKSLQVPLLHRSTLKSVSD